MLFRRKNSSLSLRNEAANTPYHAQLSPDSRFTSSETVVRKSIDSRRQRAPVMQRIDLSSTVESPLPSLAAISPMSVESSKSSYFSRFSEDTIGRDSLSSWVTSQRSAQWADTLESLPEERRDACGELRTVRGESLSLFPRQPLRRTRSFTRPSSHVSTSDSLGSSFGAPMRAVPERLADGLRTSTRRLKHSASKLSLLSVTEENDETDKTRVLKGPCSTHAPHTCACETTLACTISDPLQFRHVTHALPQQFKDMASRSHSDLVADFSTVRASQMARLDLRGIKAQDIVRSGRSSLDGTSSTVISAAPSLVSSSSCDSLHSMHAGSQESEESASPSYKTNISRQSSLIFRPSKESFSRPFPDGRPPRVDSLRTTHLYQPSYRSFSKPFYNSASVVALEDDDINSLSPVADLLSEIDNWSAIFAPELPALDEAAILTITPLNAATGQVKIYPSVRTVHHLPKTTLPILPSKRIQTVVVASDRDEETESLHSLQSSTIRPDSPTYDMRVSMLRSSVHHGLCTSWTLDDD